MPDYWCSFFPGWFCPSLDSPALAERMGERLLAGLIELTRDYSELVSSPRGQGLIAAFDLPDTAGRDAFIAGCMEESLIALK